MAPRRSDRAVKPVNYGSAPEGSDSDAAVAPKRAKGTKRKTGPNTTSETAPSKRKKNGATDDVEKAKLKAERDAERAVEKAAKERLHAEKAAADKERKAKQKAEKDAERAVKKAEAESAKAEKDQRKQWKKDWESWVDKHKTEEKLEYDEKAPPKTITKTDCKKAYNLTASDLVVLPHKEGYNTHNRKLPTNIFLEDEVAKLSYRKHAMLEGVSADDEEELQRRGKTLLQGKDH